MATRKTFPSLDLAECVAVNGNSFKDNILQTSANMLRFWKKTAPNWNYSPVMSAVPDIISKATSINQAIQTCSKSHSDIGRSQNQEVASLLYNEFFEKKITAFRTKAVRLRLPYGSSLSTIIRPATVIWDGIQSKVLMLQPRKGYSVPIEVWARYNWLVEQSTLIGETAGLSIIYADCSKGVSGEREFCVFDAETLPKISSKDAEYFVRIAVEAFEMALPNAPAPDKIRRDETAKILPLFPEL
tara:strand:+ start:34 stop:762 length:729 start_codon:yes stop_codon:yes gene_type:complete